MVGSDSRGVAASPRPAIVLEGVRKRFGALEAVRGIDLVVEAGEVVAFLGPNGAGKTTPGGAATAPGGAVTYWHVDDLTATVEKLIAMGATEYEPVTPRGNFTTASVVDPFGNVLGVMHNPHYLDMLAARTKA